MKRTKVLPGRYIMDGDDKSTYIFDTLLMKGRVIHADGNAADFTPTDPASKNLAKKILERGEHVISSKGKY